MICRHNLRIAAPEDLPEGYLRFLDKQGMINASMKRRLMGGELFCNVTHPGRTHLCVDHAMCVCVCVLGSARADGNALCTLVPICGPSL
jgi:hypothetical protein